ncbi:MAG: aspartate-semialdehyde dehydrogenase [Candidatus Caldarchaeum sp.]|nr:aspartate-semialdehyde dehydrogenase [Candidatus Caldarchaeum sp.]MCX8201541.1 aspartate-semialdehyde dehydrogenase [Candidatus Caldarchaeum sp.]MDW8434600.1 aspartate-semialdehyde dehydrogenase [Candidatus Caldarchaeum sp.]
MKKYSVAILGATGMVGQHYIKMLYNHPWFKVTALTGKESVGKKYVEAVRGEAPAPPKEIAEMEVLPTDPKKVDADFVFSCLPTEAARESEPLFAKAGIPVFSDAAAYRMEEDVPLIVPEINPDHLNLVKQQRKNRGWDGYIVTTPNCTTVGLVLPLHPLHINFGIKRVIVTTMQAVSGAGYPGVASLSIMGNIIPYISGEEKKVETETAKIFGRLHDNHLHYDDVEVFATCTRVPTLDGHMESIYVETEKKITPETVTQALEEYVSVPQELNLPTAPSKPIIVRKEPDRPQTRIDVDAGSVPGMAVTVGRIRVEDNRARFISLSHNLIRGAAGGTILTAELAHHMGLLEE